MSLRARSTSLRVDCARQSPPGASGMALQAINCRDKGADKLFSGKELREYGEKMYLTPSGHLFRRRPAIFFPLFAR
jgi:hypothetical protein